MPLILTEDNALALSILLSPSQALGMVDEKVRGWSKYEPEAPDSYSRAMKHGASFLSNSIGLVSFTTVMVSPNIRGSLSQAISPYCARWMNASSMGWSALSAMGSDILHNKLIQPLLATAAANDSGMLQVVALGLVVGSSYLLEARGVVFAAVSLGVTIGLTMTGAALGIIDHMAELGKQAKQAERAAQAVAAQTAFDR
jgi:hypothetical protein